jgi:hypothetical protein
MDAERCPHRDERLELPGLAPDESVDQLLDVGREGGSAWVAVRESVEHFHVRPDALAEPAGAGEGTLITDEERDRRRDHGLKQVAQGVAPLRGRARP